MLPARPYEPDLAWRCRGGCFGQPVDHRRPRDPLSPDGRFSTVAGNGTAGPTSSSGDGGTATSAALHTALSLALDAGGSLYVSEGYLSGYAFGGAADVLKVAADGTINTIAGNGTTGYSGDAGPATAASFSAAAAGIAVDTTGAVYVADIFNNVIRILRPISK